MSTVEAFGRVARRLVDEIIEPGIVLGRNETIYGYNEAMDERIADRDIRYREG